MDFKSTVAKLVDLDKVKGVVRHYWGAFNNLDSDGDIIVNGAYLRSIRERGPGSAQPRIKFLWQHMRQELRGIPTELLEDSVGLLSTTQITLGRPKGEGEDLLLLYDAGVINEHSVGIDILNRDEEDRRIIREVRLWEGSAVTWGANPLTPLVDMKAEDLPDWIDSQIKRAEKAANCGVRDETARSFDVYANILKSYKKEIGLDKQTQDPTNELDFSDSLDIIKSINRQLDFI